MRCSWLSRRSTSQVRAVEPTARRAAATYTATSDAEAAATAMPAPSPMPKTHSDALLTHSDALGSL
eukprot:7276722-Prymnesium_polylepis.1